MQDGKRNRNQEKPAADDEGAAPGPRGGGLAGRPLPAGPGAGYLESCTNTTTQKKVAAPGSAPPVPDAEEWLLQLQACGINQGLLRVARRVGFEAFMEIWAELDRDDSVLDERRRLHIPHMDKTLLRYQRARIIRAMGEKGMKAAQILEALPPRLRSHLSRRTVVRIITGK